METPAVTDERINAACAVIQKRFAVPRLVVKEGGREVTHTCHALGCDTPVPPRLFAQAAARQRPGPGLW
jgi:hypothetical protein